LVLMWGKEGSNHTCRREVVGWDGGGTWGVIKKESGYEEGFGVAFIHQAKEEVVRSSTLKGMAFFGLGGQLDARPVGFLEKNKRLWKF